MELNELKSLIRTEIQRVIMEDATDGGEEKTQQMVAQGGRVNDKLSQLPGAPFGGDIYRPTGVVVNNAAREALGKWIRLTKAALAKHGHPTQWPQNVVDAAQKLGADYENLAATSGGPSVGYHPRNY